MTAMSRPGARERVGNLPGDVTSFVGRRREIGLLKQVLASSHLVTLSGPGGVGKTRLAVHVAASLQRRFYPDGAWFVELAELRDPTLLASKVSEAFGLRDQSSRAAVDVLVAHLESRDLLLVLDSCEHLLEECAPFVDTLIRACPRLRVVATSRQSLGVPGETTLSIPPLPVPPLPQDAGNTPPDPLEHYSSVRLFVDRAKDVLPEFTLDSQNAAALVRLCHRLDGIPLAIELAAVRLRALSLEQIEERLGERYQLLTNGRRVPARHQALAALMDWSYELCSEQERLAWARTSVFSGSFDLAAAEHVLGGGELRRDDVFNVIDSLVDKSILVREHDSGGPVRYRLLETLRQYGQEKLVAADESIAVRRRHRDWYACLTERFAAEWLGPDQAAWVARLRREHSNLRAALEFCVTQPGEAVVGLRMAADVEEYWWMRGVDAEARYWIEEALAAAPEAIPERVTALRVDGWFALFQGDFGGAGELLAEGDTLAEKLGVEIEKAYLIHTSGARALFSNELDAAVPLLEDGLRRFRAVGSLRGELFALFVLGLTLGAQGKRDPAVELLDECIATTEQLGEVCWKSCALWALSQTEMIAGSLDRAEETGKAALRPQREVDNKLATAFATNTLAWAASRQGRHTRAATLFGAAEAVWQAIGASPLYASYKAANEGHAARSRKALGADSFDEAFRQGHQLSAEAAIDFALESESQARTQAGDGQQTVLTRREREIADLVAQGKTNKEIAKQLFITQRTAEGHVQHILMKLDFTSRAQIAAWVTDTKLES